MNKVIYNVYIILNNGIVILCHKSKIWSIGCDNINMESFTEISEQLIPFEFNSIIPKII